MGRLRVFLIVAILIVLVAVVVVLVLPQLGSQPPATEVAQTTGGDIVVTEPPTEIPTTPLPTATPIIFVDLVIAVQELPRGIVIPPNAVTVRPWPQDAAPFNAVSNVDDVIGKRARTDIFREQPILSNMVVEDLTGAAHVGSDAAAVLPNGLVAVSLPIDRLTSVAYAPQDGDRVDLIISMLFVDIDEAFQSITPNTITLFKITDEGITLLSPIQGRVADSIQLGPVIVGPSERQRPRLVTQRTIQDALVVHVGNFPPDGRFIGVPPTPTPIPVEGEAENGTPPPPTPTPPRPDIITLGVTPQEAVVLTWYIEAHVPVTLALRGAQDTSRTNTTEVTLDYLMGQYGISLPGKRPFTIEPAIRSIRQIIASQEIQLSDSTG